MKVLTIEQMNKLKELGVDVKPKGMCLMYTSDSSDCYYLKYGESTCEDDVAAFSLQDVIELLPDTIEVGKNNYYYLILQKETNAYYHCVYENLDLEILHRYRYSTMIESAYEMLLWVIENGYLETK